MENYEEKYKEALERARSMHKQGMSTERLEYVFPELRESKDEKIRKAILGLVKQSSHILNPMNQKSMIAWLEKQGEQKPDDKVEPKFNVGDWITNGEYTWKITDIKPLDYILQSQNGDMIDDNIFYVDENFRLWTIEDANDGDVLTYRVDDGKILIFIYEGLGESFDGQVDVHAGLDGDGYFSESTASVCCKFMELLTPATKEQRDLLFQKMKENGYRWDAEKKELKKIEQSCYHNDGLYYAINILEKTLGKVEGYQSDDGKMEHQSAIETVKALYHKKPTEWSEEYDKNLQKIIEIIIQSPLISNYKEMYISWLSSLKPQPKQEWSEEDENIRKQLIKHCSGPHELYDERNWDKWLNWLKSLKPHWKPILR